MLPTMRVKSVVMLLTLAMVVFPALLAAKPGTPSGDFEQGRNDGREFARTAKILIVNSPTSGCCSPTSCLGLMPLLSGVWRMRDDNADRALVGRGLGSLWVLPSASSSGCCMAPVGGLLLSYNDGAGSSGCCMAPFPRPVRRELHLQPISLIGRSMDYAQGYVEELAR